MFASLTRKAAHVMGDPVLRRWLIGRALGRHPGEPSFSAHRPPYLQDRLPLASEPATPPQAFRELGATLPTAAIDLPLPGLTLSLQPGEEQGLFDRTFADTETLLAVHRFAWLPLLGDTVDAAWLGAIWRAWRARHGTPGEGWAWHPYTAAERAINILRVARALGLPGSLDETLDDLARHAPEIADRLEYFGDHHTSNHLANNGRGVFLLGLWLGLPKATELGGRILIEEAARIFGPSGMLREGSSHYHLLLTKNYREVATEAAAHGRPEASALREIADRATAAAAALLLPGGVPLIGDISPDCSPEKVLQDLGLPATTFPDDLTNDGWLRYDHGPWSGLWYVAPQGWRQMPGHGHEDCGGFELHFEGAPLFIDAGRGSYGDSGDFACCGRAHNTLLVDHQDPYPPNRPYYGDSFRHQICGDDPELVSTVTGVQVHHQGFSRLGGLGAVDRRWQFSENALILSDSVDGNGTHTISRYLVTPLAAELTGEGVIVRGDGGDFRISAPAIGPTVMPVTRWTAYGQGEPVSLIGFETRAPLPWGGEIRVEKI